MTVRLFLTGERIGPQIERRAQANIKKIQKAEREAAQDVVDYVVPRARRDIEEAGDFGNRWTLGFQGRVEEKGKRVNIIFTHKVPYWRVFEFGATIKGKPLLWIPLSFAKDAQGVRARDYPGKLFRVDRKAGGAPLLLASGNPATPKYFGKSSVRIPKKFHLRTIITEGGKKFPAFFKARIKANG